MENALVDCIDKFSSQKIVVIGDLILDKYIWGDTSRISPEAPVPVIAVDRESYTPGGAANVAANLASLGLKSEVFGIVGQDNHGETLQSLLKEKSVSFNPDFAIHEAPTIVKTRILARNQQVCRLDYESAPSNYDLDQNGWLSYAIGHTKDANAVIISDYTKGIVDEKIIGAIQIAAHKSNTLVALDTKRDLAFKGVDLLTPNRGEALLLAGLVENRYQEFPYDEVCKNIYRKYEPKNLAITLGAEGMLLSQNGKAMDLLPANAQEVYDVSGAGDTVIAVLTSALASGAKLKDAATLANHAAGIAVSKVGTATVSRDELLGKVR